MPEALRGRRVVVTRPLDRAGPLIAALEAAGAEVILFPAIRVVGPADPGPLAAAAAELGSYDWLVFTSAYGVRALRSALVGPPPEGGPRVGCVGEATAAAAREAGWEPAVMPGDGTGEALASALVAAGVGTGARVLVPGAEDALEALPDGLRAAGAEVTEVVAYRKVGPGAPDAELRARLEAGAIDALTFTSPSTARNFVGACGKAALAVPAVVIGDTTAAAARALGFRVVAVAAEPTVEGLVVAATRAFNERTDDG